jgi:hypothetical protein
MKRNGPATHGTIQRTESRKSPGRPPPPPLNPRRCVMPKVTSLNSSQRRAYIDTSRRSLPIDEIERKARKAKGRHGGWAESADLALARSAAWYQRAASAYGILGNWWPINFCSQCSEFGRGKFDKDTGRFERPIAHKPRCIYGGDQSPYPGFSAVVSALLRPHPTRSDERYR